MEIGTEQNMALDASLLESFISGESLQTVRVYRWSEPCVTVGRNQSIEEARGPYPELNIFRRPTGGRAVVHGDDLTITVVACENTLRKDSEKGGILASYHQIVAGIIDTFLCYGVRAITGQARRSDDLTDCFATVGKCDVVDSETGVKIVGSAQFRSRGAILQQMSIRRHQRYHIHDTDFLMSLKDRLSRRLAVDQWEVASAALPTEYSRCSLLLGSQVKGADIGTKNSYV